MAMQVATSFSARLHPYFDILEHAGLCLELDLGRARIPIALLERPDIRFSGPIVHSYIEKCGNRQGIPDLDYLGARQESFASIEPHIQRWFESTRTLNECLELYIDLLARYNHRVGHMSREGSLTRLSISYEPGFGSESWLRFSDWSNLMVLVGIIRHALGANWVPVEITLQSRTRLGDQVFEDLPNTHILVGQECTSLTLPACLLTTPMPGRPMQDDEGLLYEPVPDFPDLLREALAPYLAEPYLSVELAAEMACTSTRSLQRELARSGLSYSQIIQQARYERAAALLHDSNTKIIDVAMEVGIDDPAHFARAFRRSAGMSPREYQRLNAGR